MWIWKRRVDSVCEEPAVGFVLQTSLPKKGEIKVGVWELLISPYFTYAGSGFCVFHVLIIATNVYKELVIYVLSTLKQRQKK